MGKIRKLKESELIGGTSNSDIYPITSTDAVYDSKQNSLTSLLASLQSGVNNNKIQSITFSALNNKTDTTDANMYFVLNNANTIVGILYQIVLNTAGDLAQMLYTALNIKGLGTITDTTKYGSEAKLYYRTYTNVSDEWTVWDIQEESGIKDLGTIELSDLDSIIDTGVYKYHIESSGGFRQDYNDILIVIDNNSFNRAITQYRLHSANGILETSYRYRTTNVITQSTSWTSWTYTQSIRTVSSTNAVSDSGIFWVKNDNGILLSSITNTTALQVMVSGSGFKYRTGTVTSGAITWDISFRDIRFSCPTVSNPDLNYEYSQVESASNKLYYKNNIRDITDLFTGMDETEILNKSTTAGIYKYTISDSRQVTTKFLTVGKYTSVKVPAYNSIQYFPQILTTMAGTATSFKKRIGTLDNATGSTSWSDWEDLFPVNDDYENPIGVALSDNAGNKLHTRIQNLEKSIKQIEDLVDLSVYSSQQLQTYFNNLFGGSYPWETIQEKVMSLTKIIAVGSSYGSYEVKAQINTEGCLILSGFPWENGSLRWFCLVLDVDAEGLPMVSDFNGGFVSL